jgi:hypothetical protein
MSTPSLAITVTVGRSARCTARPDAPPELTQASGLYVPEGGIHAFRNESGEPASMLILFAPGAPRESYFETLAEVGKTGRTLTPGEWEEFYLRHDTYWT